MNFKRKLFIVVLSLATVFACVFGFAGCDGCNKNPDDSGNLGDPSHTYAEGWTGDNDYHWHAATDGSDAVSGKALHDWQLAADESVAATCSSAGANVYKCSVCKDTKREATSQLTHVWSADVKTEDPTCITGGRKYKTCSNEGCDATSTVEYIQATGHKAKAAATCTQASECSVCNVTISPALGHDYQVVRTIAATCSADGSKHYKCSHDGCEEEYDEKHETKLPHNIVWEDEGKVVLKNTADLCYTITYNGQCVNEGCEHKETKSTDVTSHAYTTAITTVATCSADGTKTLTCKNCEYHTTENYKDANAHTWNSGAVSNGITTFTCTHNSAHTKQSVVSASTRNEFSVEAVKTAGEVTLADTSIKLDDGVKNALPAGNVTLGAEKLGLNELEGVDLDNSDAEIITGTVFNLTLNAGGQYVSDLGGTVSVTVPYEISAGEDPNNIIILYINGDKLEEVTGVYSNGFVTFETTHFSYYTVTKMTPAERCAKFGHAFTTYHQEPTCLLAGYDINFCTRCGINQREDIAALGHDWKTEKTEATCTANGKTHHECKRCDVEYDIKIPAYGHVWEATVYSAATCQASGHATYKCELCEETYSTTLPQTAHTLISTKVEATCTTSGYTRNECIVCKHVNETDHVDALGHTTATRVVEATCTVNGFTQTYCTVCNTEISKTNVVNAKGHSLSNGVCTVCGYGCEHSYVAGDVVDAACETEGYILYTCSKCHSSYKGNVVNALGHKYNADECTVCHKLNPTARDYYLNLVNTALNGTVSITVKEFSFSVKTLSYVNGELTGEQLEGSAQQLDVVKLTLTLSADGDIIGAGEGKVQVTAATSSNNVETVSIDCDIVIKDGALYIVVDSDNAQVVPKMYMSMELDYVFGAMSDGALNYDTVKEYLLWYNGKVSPVLNSLITTNGDIVVSVLRLLINNLFTVEINSDGYTYTLDFTAVEKLNDKLYTTTAKDLVENLLGEGVYANIPSLVTTVLNLTPKQALTFIQKYGVDKKQVCAAVDAFMLLMKGEEFNSEEMLDKFLSGKVSEDGDLTYNDITVAELLIMYTHAQANKAEFIAQAVEMVTATLDKYKDSTVYEIIADVMSNMPGGGGSTGPSDKPSEPEPVKPMAEEDITSPAEMLYNMVSGYIGQYLPMVQNGVQLSFSTDKAGNIISAKIAADIKDLVMFGHDGDSSNGESHRTDEVLNVKGEAEFTFGGNSTVDDKIISIINAAKPKFERNSVITAYSNKHLDVKYSEMFPNLFTLDKGEEMLVHTDVRGNIVKIVVTSETRTRDIYSWSGYTVYCYEYLEKEVQEYDFTGGSAIMISKNYCGNIDMYEILGMRTSYSEYTTYQRVIHGRTQVILSDRIIDNHTYEPHAYYSSKSFYYDTVTKTYTSNNPHSYDNLVLNEVKSKIECGGYYYMECEDCGYGYKNSIYHLDRDYHNNPVYELTEGSTSCEDGVIIKYVCRECNEVVYSSKTYGHATYLKDTIDCSEYSNTCEHSIYLYGCACGEYLHTYWRHNDYWNYGNDRYGKGFDSIRRVDEYRYIVNDKEQWVTVYACVVVDKGEEGTCGFNFAYYTDYTKDSTCYATHVEHIIFNVTIDNETGVVTGGTVYTGKTLPYDYYYEHNRESTHTETANGYVDERKCVDCGLKVEKTEYSATFDANERLVSSIEIYTRYKDDAKDNTESRVTKRENVYTYHTDGQPLSETITYTYYNGAMTSDNLDYTEKYINSYTYNTDGSRKTYCDEYQYYDKYNKLTNTNKWEYVYVQGERFATLHYSSYDYYDEEGNYSEEPSRWSKMEYDYSDGYCSPMIKESTQSGESPVRPGVVSHRVEGDYITPPTCTQLGTRLCKFCHHEVQDTDYYFEGHYYQNGVCVICGLENPIELNGRVILEDLSYTSETKYVIGYYNREGDAYSFQFSLINLDADDDDNEFVLRDVNYYDSNEGVEELKYYRSGKIEVSVGQIAQYASEYGIENYMIRVYFVSEKFGSTLDYAITIDAHNWVEGTLIYSHYDPEIKEQVDETITVKYCSVCGIVLNYGYLNLKFAGEDETSGMYHYYGYQGMVKNQCELIVSAPIANIEIPSVEEAL